MNETAHQQRALDLEQSIVDLGDPATKPYICALAIEGYWGAAFHWIVVGCIRKHQWHTDSHAGLVAHLKGLGETAVATHWTTLERLRSNGFYTYQATAQAVAAARQEWQEVRTWALS
jgi:hypothetical protein